MIRAVLKISEENGILKEIVKKRITIKHSNGKEMTYTPFTYAEACENSEAVRELGNLLNKRATQQPTVVTAKTTTARSEKVLQDNIVVPTDAYENSNKSSLEESIEHKPCENSNESNTIAIEHIAASIEKLDNTGICENSTSNILTEIAAQPTLSTADSTDKANTLSSTEMKSCFDNRSGKENTVNEKEELSTKVVQQRRAIMAGVVDAVLLASGVAYENACSSSGCGNSWTSVCRFCVVQCSKSQYQARESRKCEAAHTELKHMFRNHKHQIKFLNNIIPLE